MYQSDSHQEDEEEDEDFFDGLIDDDEELHKTNEIGDLFENQMERIVLDSVDPPIDCGDESSLSMMVDNFLEQLTDHEVILTKGPQQVHKKEKKMPIVCIPRDYQMQLFHIAKDKNSIIYLGTGLGKTVVLIMMIWYRIKQNPHKKIIFLGNTIQLVEQQASQIENLLPEIAKMDATEEEMKFAYKLAKRTKVVHGSKYPDNWHRSRWKYLFECNEIFVFTAQLFLNLLRTGQIRMDEIQLICFDECHACASDHQFNLIMKEFYFPLKSDIELQKSTLQLPQIVGSTASPVIGSKTIKLDEVLKELMNLSANMNSTYVYANPDTMAEFLQTTKIDYLNYDMLFNSREVQMCVDYGNTNDQIKMNIINQLRQTNFCPDFFEIQKYLLDTRPQDFTMRILIRQLHEQLVSRGLLILLEFGVYGYFKQLRFATAQLKLYQEDQCLQNKEHQLNNIYEYLKKKADKQQPITTLTPKTLKLLKFLEDVYRTAADSMCIIFVKQRNSAAYLNEIIGDYFQQQKIEIRSSYIIGHVGGNRKARIQQEVTTVEEEEQLIKKLSKELEHDQSKFTVEETKEKIRKLLIFKTAINSTEQKNRLEMFRAKKIQLLISTSVAEEGIDIPSCNYVIGFNIIQTSKAFVQMKGRARMMNSRFVIMMPEIREHAKIQTHQQVQLYTEQQIKVLVTREEKVRAAIKNMQAAYQAAQEYDCYIIGNTGACLNTNWSQTLLNSFTMGLELEGGQKQAPRYAVFQVNPSDKNKEIKYIAFLLLPLHLKKFLFYGSFAKSTRYAKALVAMKAGAFLYEQGYLDDYLKVVLSEGVREHFGADEEDPYVDMTKEQILINRKYCKQVVIQQSILSLFHLKIKQRFYFQNGNSKLKEIGDQKSYLMNEVLYNGERYMFVCPKALNFQDAQIFIQQSQIDFGFARNISQADYSDLFTRYQNQVAQQFNLHRQFDGLYVHETEDMEYRFLPGCSFFICLTEDASLKKIYVAFIHALNACEMYKIIQQKRPKFIDQKIQAKVNILLENPHDKLIKEYKITVATSVKPQLIQVLIVPKQPMETIILDALALGFSFLGQSRFRLLVALQSYFRYFTSDVRLMNAKARAIMKPTHIKNCLLESNVFQYIKKDFKHPFVHLLTGMTRKYKTAQENDPNFTEKLRLMDKDSEYLRRKEEFVHISNNDFAEFLYKSLSLMDLQDGMEFINKLDITKISCIRQPKDILVTVPQMIKERNAAYHRIETHYQQLELVIGYSFDNWELLFRSMTDISYRNMTSKEVDPTYMNVFKDEGVHLMMEEELNDKLRKVDQIGSDSDVFCNQNLVFIGRYVWQYLVSEVIKDYDILKQVIGLKLLSSHKFLAYIGIKLQFQYFLQNSFLKQLKELVTFVQQQCVDINNNTAYITSSMPEGQATEMVSNAFKALVGAMYLDCKCSIDQMLAWIHGLFKEIKALDMMTHLENHKKFQFLKWYQSIGKDPLSFDLLKITHQDYAKMSKGIRLYIPFDKSTSQIFNVLQDRFSSIDQLHIFAKNKESAWQKLCQLMPSDQQI